MNSREKLILIDGNGLAYRAFYALPPLKTSRGEAVNAVYGFTNMLFKIIEREEPEYIAVAFDKSRPTVRQEQFDEYKAHRQKMPEDLQEQFPIIEQVVEVLKIPIYSAEGYEADDSIATLERAARERGISTKIYSGDLDMLQLVSDNTNVVTTRRGLSDLLIYDREMVKKRYGIEPRQLVDYKALAGDSSDHIPGIPGIGEASASKLLNQFENIESMYEQVEKIPSRWRKQILENKEQAYLSKRLASLEANLDFNIDWDILSLKEPDRDNIKKLFVRLEFKNLLKKLGFKDEELQEIQEMSIQIVSKDEDLGALCDKLRSSGHFSIHWIADEEEKLIGLAVADKNMNGYYFPFEIPEQMNISSTFGISTFSQDRIIHELKPLMDNPDVKKYVFDLKEAIKYLKRSEYFSGKNFMDLTTASFLMEPDNPAKTPEDILSRYTDFTPKTLEAIMQKQDIKKKIRIIEIPLQDLSLFIASRAIRLNNMGPDIENKLKEAAVDKVLMERESLISSLLVSMEARGIRIDSIALSEASEKYEKILDDISKAIYQDAGGEFNIKSNRQLGKVLFEDLKLPDAVKTRTGYKTGSEILIKLVDVHPIVGKILHYKEISRIKATFIDNIKDGIEAQTGKIHLHFKQNATANGKIASSSPNFESMPVEFRKMFIPGNEERVLLSFEYKNLDLRFAADFSGDEALINLLKESGHIDQDLAVRIFGVSPGEVTEEMKQKSAWIAGEIPCGLTAHNLAAEMNITRTAAQKYINNYFEAFPDVRDFMDKALAEARERGFVETLQGRKLILHNINSENRTMRSIDEKMALGFKIRGSCYDLMKVAMTECFAQVLQGHRDIHVILVREFEMVFDTRRRRADKYSPKIREILENIYPCKGGLKVEVREGFNWMDMKETVEIKS